MLSGAVGLAGVEACPALPARLDGCVDGVALVVGNAVAALGVTRRHSTRQLSGSCASSGASDVGMTCPHTGGASAPPLVDRGLRRGLGRETELREPVLHVEVEPVARDNPVLDRHDVALAEPHTPARRGKSRR